MGHSNTRRRLAAAIALSFLVFAAAPALGKGRPPGAGGGGGKPGGGVTSGDGQVIAILPDGTLRELCTWFNQVTESPFTTPEGRSESASTWRPVRGPGSTRSARGGGRGGLGYTRGLPRHWDVGASLATWSGLGLTTGPASLEAHPAGFGGGSLKVRHTVFGVDSAGVAVGLAASFHVPGSASSPGTTAYEGTLSLPLAASLPFDFTLGAMAQVGSIADAEAAGRHLRWIESLKLERELAPHLSGWIEGASISHREPAHPWLGTVDGGMSADLWGHVSLNVGAAMGRSGATTDHGFFGGVGLGR